MNGMRVVKNLRISGLVQGVGFRDALMQEATRIGVGGWVRNRTDGSVEAVVSGAEESVGSLIAWAHRGPPGARVDQVLVTELTSSGIFPTRFEQRPTI